MAPDRVVYVTVIVPVMYEWIWQWKGYRPGVEKVMKTVVFGLTVPESKAPPSAVTVCGAVVVLVTVIRTPR